MKEAYAHEAWCPHCKVTHPPERKQCLHCGGPLFPHRPPEDPTATRAAEPFGMPAPAEEEQEAAEAKGARAASPLRFGVAAIWIVLGILTAILRACSERG
jgi:hypothetical protein